MCFFSADIFTQICVKLRQTIEKNRNNKSAIRNILVISHVP